MNAPSLYALFCLTVLSTFIYGKYEGLALFGLGTASQASGTGGSHYSGVFLGAHK
jgi:hypothetical protein